MKHLSSHLMACPMRARSPRCSIPPAKCRGDDSARRSEARVIYVYRAWATVSDRIAHGQFRRQGKPMNACADCSVRERAICQSLCEADLDELNRLGRQQTIDRGQTLQWQGDDSMLVGNVIDGVLKLSSSSVDGHEQTLGIIFPSDFIGRPFGQKSNHSIVALTDAKVCTFPRSAFDEFARGHPDLEHRLLERTL